MLVENKYNWFCFSICSKTQVIMNKSKKKKKKKKKKNDVLGNSPVSKLGVLF